MKEILKPGLFAGQFLNCYITNQLNIIIIATNEK